jgi:carbon monoxide dehydrogenase subunit G
MRLENAFEVPAPPEQAWALLMDVPRVVPCMPGAELTETVDDTHWKAKVAVKLGPIALTFAADVERTEADEAARRVVLATRARELRGRGAAQATIESSLAPADGGGTQVSVVTDLSLSGAAAQFGGAVVKDVAAQLTRQFAECLQEQLAEPAAASAVAAPRAPLSGLRLLLGALLARFRRLRRSP